MEGDAGWKSLLQPTQSEIGFPSDVVGSAAKPFDRSSMNRPSEIKDLIVVDTAHGDDVDFDITGRASFEEEAELKKHISFI